jgi:membrane-associated phospholipid phosphatase
VVRRMRSTSHQKGLYLDELCLLLSFSALCVLGATGESQPLFESFGNGRLTMVTVWGLPILLLLAATMGRVGGVRSFIAAYWPIVATLAVYESLKHLHANRITLSLGIAPKDNLMLRIDEMLFGQALPLHLQGLATPYFVQVMGFFYVWVYYVGPVFILSIAYFVWRDKPLFIRLRLALVLGLLGGYVLYLVVPVAGPLFLIGEKFTRPIATQPIIGQLAFDQLRYNWDCFPSLHTAIPWLLTFVVWRRLGWLGRCLAVAAASGVTLSTVVLRYHYGIDLIAGILWAILVAQVVLRNDWLARPLRLRW